jgi:MFS family permease
MMMTSVMVMTPVSMNNEGMSLQLVGIVSSVHTIGMYAASPIFGWMADRIGPARVIWTGVGFFLCAFLLGAWHAVFVPDTMEPLLVSLGMLGLGWSACLIGGSALLVESVPEDMRVPLQGVSDSLMNFGAAALAALAGHGIHRALGAQFPGRPCCLPSASRGTHVSVNRLKPLLWLLPHPASSKALGAEPAGDATVPAPA